MTAALDPDLCAEALFCTDLQPSDHPDLPLARSAACAVVFRLGEDGCAAVVAQEFGDHPGSACERMRWAREMAADAFGLAAA